ncbi:MAG: hypothetical protein AAF645_10470 [Myxococcota bacterium]
MRIHTSFSVPTANFRIAATAACSTTFSLSWARLSRLQILFLIFADSFTGTQLSSSSTSSSSSSSESRMLSSSLSSSSFSSQRPCSFGFTAAPFPVFVGFVVAAFVVGFVVAAFVAVGFVFGFAVAAFVVVAALVVVVVVGGSRGSSGSWSSQSPSSFVVLAALRGFFFCGCSSSRFFVCARALFRLLSAGDAATSAC